MSDKYDRLKLDNQLCFPLYACSKEVVRRYKPFLDKINLTYTQYITMMVLWEKNEIGVKALGERLYLDSGTLSPLLKTLEKKGLLERKRDEEDERNLRVRITEKGTALRDDAVDIPLKMGACLNIDAEEAQTLYRILHKLMSDF
ncbi:MAG: MarR family transcriptional regulator [Clostridia bacterium]|nr:MarR family transcriptional regulator [Clostridia bacterium]